ncbi:YfcC family protein [Peribacillus butanolivorans]|uniref:YfcC family protein n=1 Tax=Peribacillus butanolivorans TaxID=421767 RepID=UPI0035DA6481
MGISNKNEQYQSNGVEQKKGFMKKKFVMPHIYVILVAMLVVAYVATLLVPSGQFSREKGPTGADVLVPGTFEVTKKVYLSITDLLFAIPTGLIQASEIFFGILMIGGMFAVFERTGIIELGISKLATLFSNRGILIIPFLMIPLALLTAFTGSVELVLVYVPVFIPLMLKLGYDRVTGAALALISTIAGFTIALTAPATVGLAQKLVEVELYSGMGFRSVMFAVILIIGIVFLWRYAVKVKKNPQLSLVYGDTHIDDEFKVNFTKVDKATTRQLLASFVLLIGVIVMIYGLINLDWYFKELAGLYAVLGIVVGLIAGLKPDVIASSFNDGFKNIILGAAVVGIARAISVILAQGQIIDTIVHGLGQIVTMMPHSITPIIMMVVQALLNFVIPSATGQAMISMPIMGGLADISGVTRQTAVLAYQIGDGFSHIFYPTSGYFMATLALAKIPYNKWIKFILPLMVIWYLVSAIFLVIAQTMNW